ncbi:MAG: hypothetical protein ACI9C1_001208 [Candidatus Aldehydirespiratoraceae bacterium]
MNTGGADTAWGSRAVVFATECSGEYEGRRLYWGVEYVDYGDRGPRREQALTVELIETDTVAEVLSVTARRGTEGFDRLVGIDIAVEYLDGSEGSISVDRE